MIERLSNIKLQSRLMLAFAAVSLLGTVAIAWTIKIINDMNLTVDDMAEDARQTQRVIELQGLLDQQEATLTHYLTTDDPATITQYAVLSQQSRTLMNELAFEIDDRWLEELTIDDVATDYQALDEVNQTLISAHKAGNDDTARSTAIALLEPDSPLMTVSDTLEAYTIHRDALFDGASDDAGGRRQGAVIFAVIVLLLMFLASFMATLVANDISQPVIYLTNAVTSFENGLYQDELLADYQNRQDEIGTLIRAFRNMVDSITEADKHKTLMLMSAGRFVPDPYLDFLNKPSIVDIDLGDHVSANMAVMFSDIRGFTTMSEHMTPEENFHFINQFLQRVSPAVEDNNGFIVKFLGDGMMALFPYDVEDAIRAGLEKQREAQEIGKEAGGNINMGIGIHLGDMTVGMVGEEDRIQGDAFSDNVNLTSRIEGLNKTFGTSFIISEEARRCMPDPEIFRSRVLGKVQVTGRDTPITLYEIFEADPEELRKAKEASLPRYQEALERYQAGDFKGAQGLFKQIVSDNPKDSVAAFYVEQTDHLLHNPPGNDWQGVIVMTSK